ncbi:ABC transporter ATP-binding protein YvcR [Pseudomonas coronafaciens pv. garcae]|nr:ABC transporter ATP-binding protein YvcR [Pseudomonas coronafaciens pv. garcae]
MAQLVFSEIMRRFIKHRMDSIMLSVSSALSSFLHTRHIANATFHFSEIPSAELLDSIVRWFDQPKSKSRKRISDPLLAGSTRLFAKSQLLDSLNALENVMLPMELEGRKDAREKARHLLERVGLGQRLTHTPRQLSGGEQQRVAIARAFAANPDVLFADEPTGNLDSHTGERISDLLFELNKERNTTLVLVTHDERLAHRCHRLIRLEGGRMVAPLEP